MALVPLSRKGTRGANRPDTSAYLPTTRDEMDARGWDQLDILIVNGDAYVDHPAFGGALIGRFLEGRRLRAFRAKPMPMLISFGDITTWLVAGEVAVASPVLAAAKEGVYQATMARLASPYEPLEYSSGIVSRAVMAGRRLLLPQLTPRKLFLGLTGSRIIF